MVGILGNFLIATCSAALKPLERQATFSNCGQFADQFSTVDIPRLPSTSAYTSRIRRVIV